MELALLIAIFNGIPIAIFAIYSILNKYKQDAALKVIEPEEFSKAISKIDKISKFVKELMEEEDLSDEEVEEQQKEQLKQMEPLVEMISKDIFSRFQKSKAGLTRGINHQERQLDKVLFEDGLEAHPQGDLIQAAIDYGLIGKSTLKLIQKNPLMLDFVMTKFAPQLEQLQNQLENLKNTAKAAPKGNSSKPTLSFLK